MKTCRAHQGGRTGGAKREKMVLNILYAMCSIPYLSLDPPITAMAEKIADVSDRLDC